MSPDPRTYPNRRQVTVSAATLADRASAVLDEGYRLALVAAHDDVGAFRVVYLFVAASPDRRVELVLPIDRTTPRIPSLAGLSFPAGRFEREIRDLFGIEATDHPLPRRLVLHQHWPDGWFPMRRDAGPPPTFGDTDEPYPFLTVGGTGVYEIPVGPIHAGLIEPGHFRFSAVGETILKLKARLWFVHKGIEKLAEGKLLADALPLRLARHHRPPGRIRARWHRQPAEDRRPFLLQLAGPPSRPGRHHRPRLPSHQQELQSLLRRERPVMRRQRPVRRMKIETVQRWVASVILIHVGSVPAISLAVYSIGVAETDHAKGVGLWIMSGVIGLLTISGVLLIFQRSVLSPWLLLGALPTAITGLYLF
jgi:Ni,Fe-hydrogenase III component G